MTLPRAGFRAVEIFTCSPEFPLEEKRSGEFRFFPVRLNELVTDDSNTGYQEKRDNDNKHNAPVRTCCSACDLFGIHTILSGR